MLYLRRFSLPGQGAEASFLARDSENKRTCYGSLQDMEYLMLG